MAILNSDYGCIVYTLTRRKGMKNIRIKIKENGSVCVSANTSVSLDKIESFIRDKAEWIIKTGSALAARNEQKMLLEPRENCTLNLWGKKLTLHSIPSFTEECKVENGCFNIYTLNAENVNYEHFIAEYAVNESRGYLKAIVDKYIRKSGYSDVPYTLVLKHLKSKWGHCNYAKHEIMLNLSLCGLPEVLIEYVAAHEVAHLFVHNHSPQFYAFGETLLPGFKKLDRQLNKYKTDFWFNVLSSEE